MTTEGLTEPPTFWAAFSVAEDSSLWWPRTNRVDWDDIFVFCCAAAALVTLEREFQE